MAQRAVIKMQRSGEKRIRKREKNTKYEKKGETKRG